jgi:hypothetical protein
MRPTALHVPRLTNPVFDFVFPGLDSGEGGALYDFFGH